MFVFDNRADRVHVSAYAGELAGQEQAGAAVRLVLAIDAVKGEAGRDLAGAATARRVMPADAIEVDGLDVLLRCWAKCLDAGKLIGVREANAFERSSDWIAR